MTIALRPAILAILILFSSVAGALGQDTASTDASLRAIIAKFAGAKHYSDTSKIINELGETGDPEVTGLLRALSEGDLYIRKSDRTVFIAKESSDGYQLFDPLTGKAIGNAASGELDKVKVKNSIRSQIRDMIGGLTLASKDPAVRLKAAETVFQASDVSAIPALDAAIARETDATVKQRLVEARASAVLKSDASDADKAAAIAIVAARGDRDALARLNEFAAGASGDLKADAEAGVKRIQQTLAMWRAAQNVWYGISLGSVLLLAAIGLAITFGVMGVINMAHGEMVMLGAYSTFVVQEVMRSTFPGLLDWSLVIALPLAFLVAGGVGLILERGIIRFLYGRPLETLLATWGVSLILQQAVRTIFGPTNRDVSNPSWMSGAFELGQMQITWNRLYIVIFALVVFAVLLWAFNRTSLGLRMRAVTQNRRMAAAMGIRTPWIDAMTFALGSGIAGMAGVALSQIDNVSPNLGQSYIIDSFMVVVFGGVGNLWGTLVGGLSLGIVNKFLEPYAGAVLGKILVLVFIILFIQRRPRGLFALKGRAVEA